MLTIVVICAVAVLVLGLGPVVLGRDAQIAQRVILRFMFTIAIPLCVIFGIGLYAAEWLLDIQTPVWPALIGGLVIAAGWLTTAVFNELARNRDKEERLRDHHKALYAEIQDTLSAYYGEGEATPHAQKIIDKMSTDPQFVPFIPKENRDRVFTALVADIHVLPRQTINPIVAYYSVISSIAALANDMRGERFQTLEQDRRIAMYRNYIQMRERAYSYGRNTLKVIDAYAEGGPKAAQAKLDILSTPVMGQTGPAQGKV